MNIHSKNIMEEMEDEPKLGKLQSFHPRIKVHGPKSHKETIFVWEWQGQVKNMISLIGGGEDNQEVSLP
jgi:hypothetical protein